MEVWSDTVYQRTSHEQWFEGSSVLANDKEVKLRMFKQLLFLRNHRRQTKQSLVWVRKPACKTPNLKLKETDKIGTILHGLWSKKCWYEKANGGRPSFSAHVSDPSQHPVSVTRSTCLSLLNIISVIFINLQCFIVSAFSMGAQQKLLFEGQRT